MPSPWAWFSMVPVLSGCAGIPSPSEGRPPAAPTAAETSLAEPASGTCPDPASTRGPFCVLKEPHEEDEFNVQIRLVRPDGTEVWTGWGVDVASVTEEGFILRQEWTGSMGGPVPVEKRFVFRDGTFKDEEDLKRSEPTR